MLQGDKPPWHGVQRLCKRHQLLDSPIRGDGAGEVCATCRVLIMVRQADHGISGPSAGLRLSRLLADRGVRRHPLTPRVTREAQCQFTPSFFLSHVSLHPSPLDVANDFSYFLIKFSVYDNHLRNLARRENALQIFIKFDT